MTVRGLVVLLALLNTGCVEGNGNGQGLRLGNPHFQDAWDEESDTHAECGESVKTTMYTDRMACSTLTYKSVCV